MPSFFVCVGIFNKYILKVAKSIRYIFYIFP